MVSYSDKMILHALVWGIVDEEIRENVLAKTEELGLEETIKFIEAKETGRRSTAQLSPGGLANTGVNKITAYKREQRSDAITRPTLIPTTRPTGTPNTEEHCTFCNQTGHGSLFEIRKKKCPAFNKRCTRCQRMGHFSISCHRSRAKVDRRHQKQQEDQDAAQVLGIKSYSPLVSLMDSQGNKHILSPNDKIPHMVDNNGELEIATPEPQPRIDVEIQVDIAAYKQFGMECKLGKQFTDHRGRLFEPPKTSIVTDTGAQVDCLNKNKLKYLGLNESSLLETELSLGCANESDADIMGAFWGKVIHKVNDMNTVVQVLFYVLRKGGSLLSRTTITKLGLLHPTFPQVTLGGSSVTSSPSATQGRVVAADISEARQPEGECDPDSPLQCLCPTREQVQPPQKIPFQATVKNRLRLEN